jgi:RNA polymerase sigma-70 factor (ECF subfamily)
MASPIPRDAVLLQRLVQGDETAFRELYEDYQGRIFLFAYRFTKSKEAAEEIVQEVFVKLWEKREQIRIEKNFAGYLFRVTRNLIIDGLKRAALDKKVQQRIYSHMQVLRNPVADELLSKEMERLHQQAINALSEQRRAVYLLSREEELSYAEIAEKLGISKNTVRNHIVSALESIREHLSNHPDLGAVVLIIIFYVLCMK